MWLTKHNPTHNPNCGIHLYNLKYQHNFLKFLAKYYNTTICLTDIYEYNN